MIRSLQCFSIYMEINILISSFSTGNKQGIHGNYLLNCLPMFHVWKIAKFIFTITKAVTLA